MFTHRREVNMEFIKLFLSTMVVCFGLDMVWLGFIGKGLYMDTIGTLLRRSNDALTPNWPGAIVVYIAIVVGILCFALPKAEGHPISGLMWGALFGAVLYGVYDFTNYAVLNNWPLKITLIDVVWGTLLCALTTCFAVFMKNWIDS